MWWADSCTYTCVLVTPQVCLQKEQENRVRLELRITELEEQQETQTDELTITKSTVEQLQQSLDEERQSSLVLQSRVSELEAQSDVIHRTFSFTSSDMQVKLCCTVHVAQYAAYRNYSNNYSHPLFVPIPPFP